MAKCEFCDKGVTFGSFDKKGEGSISCLCKIGQEKTAVLLRAGWK